jgi:hypothetical protein
MLSTACRFLFIHIPKTGGNSIQNILRHYSDDQVVALAAHQDGVERFEVRSSRHHTHKHSTLAEYRREYGPELFDALFKFACVRNPWDRAVSYYFSPHRGRVEFNSRDFCAFIETIQPVAHYLTLTEEQPPRLAPALGNIDLVLRFERLQADFARVCERIGIPVQPLPVRNKSSRGSYRDYYDAASRRLVESRFAEEIELLRYNY